MSTLNPQQFGHAQVFTMGGAPPTYPHAFMPICDHADHEKEWHGSVYRGNDTDSKGWHDAWNEAKAHDRSLRTASSEGILMPTPCFWLDHTGFGEVALRRYHSQKTSPAQWTCEGDWHNSFVFIHERVPYTLKEHHDDSGNTWWSYPLATDLFAEPAHDDPRWPTECSKGCGYQFTEEDEWQVWISEVLRRADNGEERVSHWSMIPLSIPTIEPGGMWNAEWQRGRGWTNPDKPDDGIFLMVRCPSISGGYGNDWGVDHRASGGGYWTRTGDPRNPPTLSVTPSIETGDYHGFLGSNGTPPGYLSDHLGG